jgi:hypothetical protein
MKNTFVTLFLAVYSIALMTTTFLITQKNKSLSLENEKLKVEIKTCNEWKKFVEDEHKNEVDYMEDQIEMRESEISHWGRMYESMKAKHPKTAAELERQYKLNLSGYREE